MAPPRQTRLRCYGLRRTSRAFFCLGVSCFLASFAYLVVSPTTPPPASPPRASEGPGPGKQLIYQYGKVGSTFLLSRFPAEVLTKTYFRDMSALHDAVGCSTTFGLSIR